MIRLSASVGRRGVNLPQDVMSVQGQLNKHIARLVPLRPLVPDGRMGPLTIAAIERFQREVLHLNAPDGRVDPGGRTLRALEQQSSGPVAGASPAAPRWVTVARGEIGQREIRGEKNNSRILQYIATFPTLPAKDETAWCACFVNWCLCQAGKRAGPSALAIDWLKYGQGLDEPRLGAICVVHHPPDKSTSGVTASGNHVAFWTGGSRSALTLLGGNQGASGGKTEEVNEKTSHGYWTVLGYRWPL